LCEEEKRERGEQMAGEMNIFGIAAEIVEGLLKNTAWVKCCADEWLGKCLDKSAKGGIEWTNIEIDIWLKTEIFDRLFSRECLCAIVHLKWMRGCNAQCPLTPPNPHSACGKVNGFCSKQHAAKRTFSIVVGCSLSPLHSN
jgi:hypothetical protein